MLHAAERLHTAMPAGAKATWVTEISWSTRPPNPKAVPIQTEARWQEQAFYNLWKQLVSTVLWWQIVDSLPASNYEDATRAASTT